jgi:uncharacterized membrane protein YgcG
MKRRSLALITLFSVLLASCKGSGGVPATPEQDSPQAVRIAGDSPLEVRRAVEHALDDHKTPVFETVSVGRRVYFFPADALFVRTEKTVAVLAYYRMYVFAKSAAVVRLSAPRGPVAVLNETLPLVRAHVFDAAADKKVRAHVGKRHDAICPDCVLFAPSRVGYVHFLEDWHGFSDAWAAEEQSVPIQPQIAVARGRHPLVCILTRPSDAMAPIDSKAAEFNKIVPDDDGSCGSGGGSGGSSSSSSSSSSSNDPGSSCGGLGASTPQYRACYYAECMAAATLGGDPWDDFCIGTFPAGRQRQSCLSQMPESMRSRYNWCNNYFGA